MTTCSSTHLSNLHILHFFLFHFLCERQRECKNHLLLAMTKAPFTLKRFHSYTEQLLRIAFRIRTVYIDTNSQEYEEAKGTKNAKTLEVRPKTTEKVFLLSVSDILVCLEDNRSRKEPFSPVYTRTI